MIKINLLPIREERKKETIRYQISMACLIIFLVVVAICYFDYKLVKELGAADDRIKSIKDELKNYEKVEKEIKKLKSTEKTLKTRIKVINDLEAQRKGPVRILDELTNCVPEKLWLKSFDQKGTSLKLDAVALDNNIIAQFMTALNKSQYFNKVVLSYIKKSKIGAVDIMQFKLSCEIIFSPKEPKPEFKKSKKS
ncbi:MAG: PilN domain-containing protein [Thermodesulfobacteriota bacterium]|nr:PilN domain-containing protein [Thermodesulfobacteriota bacterium]